MPQLQNNLLDDLGSDAAVAMIDAAMEATWRAAKKDALRRAAANDGKNAVTIGTLAMEPDEPLIAAVIVVMRDSRLIQSVVSAVEKAAEEHHAMKLSPEQT